MARVRLPLIPATEDNIVLTVGAREVQLTNLRKVFWARPRRTKGDLLRYYAGVADALLPHVRDRAMVMKLFNELGPRFAQRNGGYLRILKFGFRKGDNAPMALVELLDRPAETEEAKPAEK